MVKERMPSAGLESVMVQTSQFKSKMQPCPASTIQAPRLVGNLASCRRRRLRCGCSRRAMRRWKSPWPMQPKPQQVAPTASSARPQPIRLPRNPTVQATLPHGIALSRANRQLGATTTHPIAQKPNRPGNLAARIALRRANRQLDPKTARLFSGTQGSGLPCCPRFH